MAIFRNVTALKKVSTALKDCVWGGGGERGQMNKVLLQILLSKTYSLIKASNCCLLSGGSYMINSPSKALLLHLSFFPGRNRLYETWSKKKNLGSDHVPVKHALTISRHYAFLPLVISEFQSLPLGSGYTTNVPLFIVDCVERKYKQTVKC